MGTTDNDRGRAPQRGLDARARDGGTTDNDRGRAPQRGLDARARDGGTTEIEIDRALHTLSATLNDQQLEEYDRDRVQEIVTESLGGEEKFTVDDGGGLHDHSGRRIGAIRRTDSGEWIVDRQNPAAENSDTAIPTPPPQSLVRKLLSRAKSLSG